MFLVNRLTWKKRSLCHKLRLCLQGLKFNKKNSPYHFSQNGTRSYVPIAPKRLQRVLKLPKQKVEESETESEEEEDEDSDSSNDEGEKEMPKNSQPISYKVNIFRNYESFAVSANYSFQGLFK